MVSTAWVIARFGSGEGGGHMERVMVFVDGWNLAVGFKDYLKELELSSDDYTINFERFPMELAGEKRSLANTHFYIGAVSQQDDPDGYASQQRFFSALRRLPRFDLHEGRLVPRERFASCPYCEKTFQQRFRIEKGADVQMAADILFGAFLGQYDTALLVSNDTDFIHIVKQVQQLRGKVQNADFANRVGDSRLAAECDVPAISMDKEFLKACTMRRDRGPLAW